MQALDNLVTRYTTEVKPHLQSVGEVAIGYAEYVTERLDRIAELLETEDFTEQRYSYNYVLAVNTPIEVRQVPTDEAWELEAVAIAGGGTAGSVSVRDGTNGPLRWAGGFAANSSNTAGGGGVILKGGTVISLVATQGAEVYLQFRSRRKEPPKRAWAAGQVQVGPDLDSVMDELERTSRHASAQVRQGENVIGMRRG